MINPSGESIFDKHLSKFHENLQNFPNAQTDKDISQAIFTSGNAVLKDLGEIFQKTEVIPKIDGRNIVSSKNLINNSFKENVLDKKKSIKRLFAEHFGWGLNENEKILYKLNKKFNNEYKKYVKENKKQESANKPGKNKNQWKIKALKVIERLISHKTKKARNKPSNHETEILLSQSNKQFQDKLPSTPIQRPSFDPSLKTEPFIQAASAAAESSPADVESTHPKSPLDDAEIHPKNELSPQIEIFSSHFVDLTVVNFEESLFQNISEIEDKLTLLKDGIKDDGLKSSIVENLNLAKVLLQTIPKLKIDNETSRIEKMKNIVYRVKKQFIKLKPGQELILPGRYKSASSTLENPLYTSVLFSITKEDSRTSTIKLIGAEKNGVRLSLTAENLKTSQLIDGDFIEQLLQQNHPAFCETTLQEITLIFDKQVPLETHYVQEFLKDDTPISYWLKSTLPPSKDKSPKATEIAIDTTSSKISTVKEQPIYKEGEIPSPVLSSTNSKKILKEKPLLDTALKGSSQIALSSFSDKIKEYSLTYPQSATNRKFLDGLREKLADAAQIPEPPYSQVTLSSLRQKISLLKTGEEMLIPGRYRRVTKENESLQSVLYSIKNLGKSLTLTVFDANKSYQIRGLSQAQLDETFIQSLLNEERHVLEEDSLKNHPALIKLKVENTIISHYHTSSSHESNAISAWYKAAIRLNMKKMTSEMQKTLDITDVDRDKALAKLGNLEKILVNLQKNNQDSNTLVNTTNVKKKAALYNYKRKNLVSDKPPNLLSSESQKALWAIYQTSDRDYRDALTKLSELTQSDLNKEIQDIEKEKNLTEEEIAKIINHQIKIKQQYNTDKQDLQTLKKDLEAFLI